MAWKNYVGAAIGAAVALGTLGAALGWSSGRSPGVRPMPVRPERPMQRDDSKLGRNELALSKTKPYPQEPRPKTSTKIDPKKGKHQPVTATDNAAVAAVRNVVEADRRVTIDEILIRLPPGIEIGRSSIGTIMSDVLNFRKVCARWVPRMLSENHKQQRMEAARAFLEMHQRDRDKLFSRIVTGDESWVHYSTPETKRQSMVWKKPEESAPKKTKVTISAGRVMAIVFWDCKDVLLVDYLPPNTTVNAARYCEVLTKLKAAIKRKRPGLLSRKVLLVHDNARPHAARTTQTLLENFKWEIFTHPTYSPDLAPSDFHLFPALKLHLGGEHFANDDEVQAEANHWLRRQDTAWYNSGIKKLLQRYQKCLDRNVSPKIDEDFTSSDTEARDGSNVSLRCKATGAPPPEIHWRRENHKKFSDGGKEVKGDTLNITKVSRLDMGAYLCIASNGVQPSVSKRIMLNVNYRSVHPDHNTGQLRLPFCCPMERGGGAIAPLVNHISEFPLVLHGYRSGSGLTKSLPYFALQTKVTISAGRVMAIVFWDCKDVLLVDYLPPNTTVNAARYCEVLTKLKAAIKRKRPGLLSRKVLLVHDNARPHAARTTQTLLENFKWEIFTHPTYSPDLAPSDFHLFPALKLHLGGEHFANDDEVQAEANHWLRRQDTAWYNSGIKKLLQRYQKCLDRNGDYVEK
ncbi:hypothetical protein LAZ67_2004768 [Cordylochernes scorpioides]|uniref:Ig-like domain-containing protein n=1 Tax=Cordylochernes scorpioides TaxID=51811 RepID=A0ABY6K7A5_9ARAC|nr:hypothetical protein LAZ67_2004768 [Cordylochernes scorpioides]